MVERAGTAAKLGFKAHPHMLRHACGYKLANDGHDTRALQAYLGHRNIQHTVRYTELTPTRFNDFFGGTKYRPSCSRSEECHGLSRTEAMAVARREYPDAFERFRNV
jgi:hypothetical protein